MVNNHTPSWTVPAWSSLRQVSMWSTEWGQCPSYPGLRLCGQIAHNSTSDHYRPLVPVRPISLPRKPLPSELAQRSPSDSVLNERSYEILKHYARMRGWRLD